MRLPCPRLSRPEIDGGEVFISIPSRKLRVGYTDKPKTEDSTEALDQPSGEGVSLASQRLLWCRGRDADGLSSSHWRSPEFAAISSTLAMLGPMSVLFRMIRRYFATISYRNLAVTGPPQLSKVLAYLAENFRPDPLAPRVIPLVSALP